ncbi:MAG: PQQ-binding-like beta-propeller repeat protein, partial [Balneolaceae bacterium]
KNNSLIALHAETGEEIWIHANLRGGARRGVNYWESEDRSDKRILFTMNNYIQAIDAETGESILSFGDNGLVDLKPGLVPRDPATVSRAQSVTPGKVFDNLLILGSAPGEGYLSAPGHVRAYDVVTGERVWTFHTIPQPGEYGYDTWPEEAYRYVGGANVWGELSVDVENEIVYLPTGSPTYDYYGGDRLGDNLFSNSIVALNARTGERIWHFQTIHHDLFDYDLTAAPQLITVNHDGDEIDAVAVAGKSGLLYVFDRVTGEPLWPIEERPVPQSTVPGEVSSPTQPFPTVVPPFAWLEVTADDVNPYLLTDEEREEWTALIDSIETLGRNELYTPLSDEYPTLAPLGANGGANLGHTAADPNRGIVFVYSMNYPSVYPPLEPRSPVVETTDEEENDNPGSGNFNRGSSVEMVEHGRTIYDNTCIACHGADRTGIGMAPSLLGVETRLNFIDFQQLMSTGRGEMPAFPQLEEKDLEGVFSFLGGDPDGSVIELPDGPVVASGGAPGGLLVRRVEGPESIPDYGLPFPEGSGAPDIRYMIEGYGLGHATAFRPPWSTITAYDLNEGSIMWQKPIGSDLQAAQEGAENTGMPVSTRQSMIVTSSGVLFATAKDGKLYAFDVDNGDELWSAELPQNTNSLPSMYEVNGRHYIVINATSGLSWGNGRMNDELREIRPVGEGGYVVFALPESVQEE